MTQQIETRDFEIRSTDSEKRTVVGRAVPYNETIDIGGGTSERFERGAVDLNANVKLLRDHDTKKVIGRVTEMRDEEDGLWITAKVSDTQLGNETLALVNDGAIRSFSVGFIPVKDEKQDRTIVRKKVNLKEVSLVPFPAYENASVTEVREIKEEIQMTETNNTDYSASIEEVRNHTEELERRLDVLTSVAAPVSTVPTYRSMGEWVKGIATGDDKALELHRAFDGSVSGGVLADSILKNEWVSDSIRILNNGRPTYAVFSTGVLPTSGMTLEYPLLETDTMTIEEQEAEADALAYGKVTLTSATAPVKTYGGYTDMSRQVVERSSVNFVDAAFRAMIAQYAKVTNNVMKAKLVAEAGNMNTSALGAWSATEIIDSLAESATKVNGDTGKALEFILVSSDVFRLIAKTVDESGRPLLSNSGATVNTYGSINPVGLTGSILGLPVVVDPSLPNLSFYTGASSAITSYESAGAPFRLNDENITNLTQKFSVYGYLAIAAQDPKALVKIA
jgi:HK97 family phage prohead protease